MLSLWDRACGGNSEIYQRPQGAPYTTRVSFPPEGGYMARNGGIHVLLWGGQGWEDIYVLLYTAIYVCGRGRGGGLIWRKGGLIVDHTPNASIIPPLSIVPQTISDYLRGNLIKNGFSFGVNVCREIQDADDIEG